MYVCVQESDCTISTKNKINPYSWNFFPFFSTQYTDLIRKFKTLILSSEFDSLDFIALLLDFCPLCHLLCSLVFLHV